MIDNTLIGSFHTMFIAVGIAALFAPFIIGMLYKFGQVATHKKEELGSGIGGDNSLYLKIMHVSDKNGTPNMGGILVWLVVPLVLLLNVDRTPFRDLFIYSFLTIGFWGFLDVYLTNRIRNEPKLKTLQEKFGVRLGRFLLSVAISTVIMLLLVRLSETVITNTPFISSNLEARSLNYILLVIILGVFAQLAVYSAEITDGLDGLMIGIFGIIFTALGVLFIVQGQESYLPYIGAILGVIIVDLYFNIHPARFYNGGPGAMPLGLSAFILAYISNNLLPYLIISSLTWIIMLSSMIQIISIRFFKRRIFKIAPLHHHFQSLGWSETKVTMRFWLFTTIMAFLGVYVGIIL